MGKIRRCPDDVASQVAAGEVVERPASLVKELVENSLDAGARKIWVEVLSGGARALSVRDDGCGMDRDDALLCLERHATSKIRQASDLARVRSMGFRGEALPSIASVSRIRLATRESGCEAGTKSLWREARSSQCAKPAFPSERISRCAISSTTFRLDGSFFGAKTESAHIIHGLQGNRAGEPSIAFECRRDGSAIAALPRAESLAVRIRDLFGGGYLAKLLEINDFAGEGVRLGGFSRARPGRRDRLFQFVILNGRPVHCLAVQQALREAPGRYRAR